MADTVVEGNFKGSQFLKVAGKWELAGMHRMTHVVGYEVANEGRRIRSGAWPLESG